MGETDVWLSRYHMIVDPSCSVCANVHPSIAMRLAKADIDIEVAGESQSPPISACQGVKACGCHVLTEDPPCLHNRQTDRRDSCNDKTLPKERDERYTAVD